MDPADRSVNLQLSIEQVNYEGDQSSLPTYWLNRSSPQPPLDNVVDPNTEFKREASAAAENASPEISFGLKDVIKALQNKNLPKSEYLSNISTDHPIYQQLQEAYTAVVTTKESTSTKNHAAPVAVHSSPCRVVKNSTNEKLPYREHVSIHSISCPSQVATILKEKEPQLVSDLLYLMNNSDVQPTSTAGDNVRNSEDQTSYYGDNIEVASIKEEAVVPTCPYVYEGKQLHKYPPGHITVSSEKGPPHIADQQRFRRSSQSSQGSLSNQPTHHHVTKSQSEHSFNMSLGDQATWGMIENNAPRYSSISNISDISLYNPEQKNLPNSPIPMRSPEQIAWTMQHTRDRFETGSNFSVCSSNLDSVCSEKLDTMSMISDVSGYEEEMFRIKKLLLDPSVGKTIYKKTPFPPHYNKHTDFNTTVVSTEIPATHGRSQSKKQHQEELRALENLYELKVQDLMRNLAHTEGKLEASRCDIEKFVQERNQLLEKIAELEASQPLNTEKFSKVESEVFENRQKIAQLEYNLKKAQSQVKQRELEAQQWQEEKQATERELSRQRLEAEELRLELDTKCGAVEGLRAKVAEQHSELQIALHAKLQAETSASTARTESDALRSSQIWYKDQLAKAQTARSTAQQQATASAAELTVKESILENLRAQITNLNQQLAEAGRQLVREKRSMLQQLETFEADMTAREAELTHRLTGNTSMDSPSRTSSLKVAQLESSNAELQQQVDSMKAQMKASEEMSNQLANEHAQLLGRTTTLRQSLAERDLQLQQASDQLSALDAQNCHLREEVKIKEKAYLENRNYTVKLQVSLDAANREKAEIEKAITNLNNEFAQLSTRYQRMRQEIREKDIFLLNLQTSLGEVTAERDSLKEELVETKIKLDDNSDIIHKLVVGLQQENEHFKSEIVISEQDKTNFEREIYRLKSRLADTEAQVIQQLQQNQELAGRIAELSAAKGKAERKAVKLQESLNFREEQLYTAQQGMESAYTSSRKATEKGDALEKQNKQLSVELKKIREELLRSDSVVKQYAALCRSQEQTKMKNIKQIIHTTETGCETQTVPMSDKTTMSDIEQDVIVLNKTSADFSVQHNPETHTTGTDFDKDIVNVSAGTSTCATHVHDNTSQTITTHLDNIIDIEKEKLLSKVARLEQRLSETNSGQRDDAGQLRIEVTRLKAQLEKMEIQARDTKRKNQANIGTLLRTLKDHMRGRKKAEKELEIVRAQLERLQKNESDQTVENLNSDIADLQEQLRVSAEKLEQLKEAEKKASDALIELERERGRLEGVSESHESLRGRVLECEQELAVVRQQLETSERNREAADIQAKHQLAELQKITDSSAKMVQDLHKQVLNERRESSSLKKQLSSTKVGLDTANQLLETRATELAAAREQLEQQRSTAQALQAQLTATQTELYNVQARAEALTQELQLSKEKDPVLADQLKRLSEHAQQKSQEAAASLQSLRLAEQRWSEENCALAADLAASQEETNTLRSQLDEARQLRFALQTLAAELRGALNASLQQGKMLQARIAALESAQMPDLTSSLPVPAMLDESALAELLERSAAPPPPLTHLQSCLHNLQQEVNTLQKQLEQRSVPHLQLQNQNGTA